MTITIGDFRAMGYCVKGTKKFFERHNLDWKLFLANGISEAELEKTNDAMIDRLLEFMRKSNGQ